MISDRDTIKQDVGLVIAGLLAAALFFALYSSYHPYGVADTGYGQEKAMVTSTEHLQRLGYSSVRSPYGSFRANSGIIDSIQKESSSEKFLDRAYPLYYWQADFWMDEADSEGSLNFMGDQSQRINIRLSERGDLLALLNPYEFLPDRKIEAEALLQALDLDELPEFNFSSDSLIYQRLQFQFGEITNEENGSDSVINSNGRTFLGRQAAEKIARYHLDQTAWSGQSVEVQSIEEVSLGEADGALVNFQTVSESGIPLDISLTVLPTGTLFSLDYSLPSESNSGMNLEEIIDGTRMIIILPAFFWILILLFIRFRLRLIDTKAAILVAVLAGFIFPFLQVLESTYRHIHNFGEFNISFFIQLLVGLGVIAAFTSIGYFIITAISDSIARQHWSEKLRSMDLIRVGHFVNRPLARTIIRGISYSFLIAGGWVLLLAIIPGSMLSVEENFRGHSSYFPNIYVLLENFAFYFIVAQAIFLILLSRLRSSISSKIVLVLISGLVFALLNPLPGTINGFGQELVISGIIGLCFGIVFIWEDFLTVFVALFFFVNHLVSSGGWMIEASPDASIFYSNLILIGLGFIYGGYGLYKGKSITELPKFVPEYIEELAQEERIKQELQIARKVQQSFLPASTPNIPGLDIAAICKPAYETGGDYYDFIPLNKHKLGVIIGDVSGKGIQAAFYMTFIKGVLHALCNDYKSSIEILAKANKMFRNNADKGTFISLIFGVVNAGKNTFSFSRAGHNPLLYFNSKEKKLYEYQPHGIGLGMTGEKLFRENISEQHIDFHTDDILVLFTDGVVEATSKGNSFYGDKRLQELIKTYHELSADKLLERLMDDLESFGKGAAQHDDMTMLIIKKK